jgi:O-antigen ligase
MELSILYTKYVLLFYLIYRIADTPKEVSEILLVHVIGCFYLGYLAYGANSSGRLEGVGGPDINEANALGMQLATSVMCGAMVVLLQRGWRWVVCAAAMPFVLNGLVLTGSRGAFLSVVAGGLVLTLMRPKKNSKRFYALSALALVAFGYVANEAFWQRMGTMNAAVDSQQQMDTSAESRFVIMEAQVRMAALHPLGTGHRGTVELSREFIAEKYLTVLPDGSVGQRSSHNTFMTAWVEQGVPGAIMFICIVGWCFSTGLKVRRRYRGIDADVEGHCAAICASLAVFFLAGVFVDYLKNEIQIWMFALLAALASLEKPVQPAR